MIWLDGWWRRSLLTHDMTVATAYYSHDNAPGDYWYRCGPREHVVYVVRAP